MKRPSRRKDMTMKTKWAKDTHGFYITPLLGISKVQGQWSVWFGWLYWLWTWEIN